MGHGTFWVGLRGFLKCTDSCAVIETVIEPEPLIEIAARFGRFRRDLARVGTEPVEEGLGCRKKIREKDEQSTDEAKTFHAQNRMLSGGGFARPTQPAIRLISGPPWQAERDIALSVRLYLGDVVCR